MSANDTLTRLADLLPQDQREPFYATLSRLKHLPEEDEFMLILEAMGFLTLIWREVPGEIKSVLAAAAPVEGASQTSEYVLAELRTTLSESIELPSHQDLQALIHQFGEHRHQLEHVLKRVGVGGSSQSSRGFWISGMVVAAFVLCLVSSLSWIHFERRYEQRVGSLESTSVAAHSLVRGLSGSPGSTLDYFEGRDDRLEQDIRAVIIDGSVIDGFTDEQGRGVIRLRATSR